MRWHHYAVVAFTVLFGLAAIALMLSSATQPQANAASPAKPQVVQVRR